MTKLEIKVKPIIDYANQTIDIETQMLWDSARKGLDHMHRVRYELQEKAVRDALIAMGWTPPPEVSVEK